MQSAARAVRSRAHTSRAVPMRRPRFWLICLFFFVWACAIAGRLFLLQIVEHKEYVEKARRQQMRTFDVAPRRGVLYDRNLRELAMTVLVDSIYADPAEIEDKKAAAQTLATLVHTDPDDPRTTAAAIDDRLEHGRNFAWIARRVSADVSRRAHALHMKGIYFQKEFKRFYPNNQLAAQMLGYVGTDDNGLGGLEQKFNTGLHGVPGRMFVALDARRHVLLSTERDPQPGRNLVLTIDENIQFMAEQALEHEMEKSHAEHGTIVVQDVHTGQILALAVRPTFNPNDFRHTNPDLLIDRAVSDVYEPGSTFKLVTYAAALQEHLITPQTPIDCEGGQINLYGRIIHDDQSDRGIGVVPAATALARSSDVGVIKVALMLGPQRLYNYIRAFGFGQRTGVELPGETRGLLRPVNYWQPASIGYVAMGQEEAVTPLQLVTMVSTIANGGVYLPPHILMPSSDSSTSPSQESAAPQVPHPFRPDEDLPNPLPAGAHRVISTLTAAEMRAMMESVVLDGTGKNARLDGYSSAGKTGTAQKIDPVTHRYSKDLHIGSFAGFAPVNDPAIAVAVIIDSPKGAYYGSEVAAPVFAEVAQQVLEYLGVPHDIPVQPDNDLARKNLAIPEDDGGLQGNNQDDLQALYDAANDLPSDDPLRQREAADAQSGTAAAAPVTVAHHDSAHSAPEIAPKPTPIPSPAQRTVVVESKLLKVPELTGLSVRDVIVRAADSGLDVAISGDGTARQQMPAAGTMVPAGTRIVVSCTR